MHKLQKKQLITIGIPAFNEERGIKNILNDILVQKQFKEWEIIEILVYCDGCTDSTVSEASSVNSSLIKVIDGKKRLGKTKRLQQMFSEMNGDILVMIDADVRLGNKTAINELILPFIDQKTMYVAGNVQPEPPTTFVQRAVHSSFEVFDEMRQSMNHGNNLYCCGQTFAIRRSFAASVLFPPIINEDTYLYLLCKQNGFGFSWAKEAHILYKLPLNFKDYLKQIVRSQPAAFSTELRPYFPEIIDQEAARDKVQYLTACLKAFFRNPLGVITITAINLLSLPVASYIITHYKMKWFTAESTH